MPYFAGMSLYYASLNSGSNGNCYYIGNEKDAVLIDCGISCRETERRMSRLGLSAETVRAVFISHEHSDHIRGVDVLARKYNIPVYLSAITHLRNAFSIDPRCVKTFLSHEEIDIAGITVIPFPKQHDSIDPYSFSIRYQQIVVGVFTDIGEACPNVIRHFSQCHAAFLEANYDEEMLEKGRYPFYLKRRIRGSHGHLSNHQALELFRNHRSPKLSHLVLSHLSQHNNHPEVVLKTFGPYAGNTRIEVASRWKESALYRVS